MHLFNRSKKVDDFPQTGRRPLSGLQPQSRMGPNRTFSYYAHRSDNDAATGRDPDALNERTQSADNRNTRRYKRRVLVAVVAIGLIFCLADVIMLSSSPKVVSLTTSTSQVFLRKRTDYQQAAAVIFRQWSNHNKLTINTAAVSNSMLRQFPELSAVSVALPILGHQPIIYIQPSEPSMVLVAAGANSGNFILDSNGRALLQGGDQTAQLINAHVPIVLDQNPIQISVGQDALPSTTVQFIHTVSAQLNAQHIGFTSMVLPSESSELDVYIAGQPFYVKFNTEDDTPLQQVGSFIAVYRHLQTQGVTPHQYIDVRINGRAYYK